MSTRAKHYRARQTAVRLQSICRRLAALRQRARRAVTLGLAVTALAIAPAVPTEAQTGQTAMTPSGGVLGRAVQGFRGLNDNGPGLFYYGANGADRGFGYRGSYMTLGGFIPVVEDDLGGFWAADVRTHLSEYGGFFSNVGAVRKQFIGGTLLGVGVFWDYDGDLNQFPGVTIPDTSGPIEFDGGQVYHQVTISGEWLTDFGSLRSNGYIPVGSTAQLIGPFVGNSILGVNGVNAALGGTDLEVGAFIPGLAQWGGMVSVGGYAFGNSRYEFPGGEAAVPWFGGVYTRLDMTFAENWDFSLQANNDSFFDWTGFARLTYRMGGSRRRNVPDQVEQPMMRNEHIARAHQAPVVALNPNNLDAAGNPLPWQIFHIDNTADPGGNGTVNNPFQTLAEGEAAAINPWDIVFVNVGDSLTNPLITPAAGYSFGNENQFLVGEGTSIRIPTVSHGDIALSMSNNPDLFPVITNPIGPAINVDQPGARVDHLEIRNSNVGISDGLGIAAPATALVSDVIIRGDGTPFHRGVDIANSDGQIRFDNVRLSNLGNSGFVVSALGGNVAITNSTITDVSGEGLAVTGDGAVASIAGSTMTRVNGTAMTAIGDDSVIAASAVTITDTQGFPGHAVEAFGDRARITLTNATITTATGSGIAASGLDSVVIATDSAISNTGNPAVSITGAGATVVIDNTDISDIFGTGVVVNAPNAVFQMVNGSTISDVTLNGIDVLDPSAFLFVGGGSMITNIGSNGIFSDGASMLFQESTIQTVGRAGILAQDVSGTGIVAVQGGTIRTAQDGGILVSNSNLRVERLDPTDPRSRQTTIANTGVFGIQAVADTILPTNAYQVLVADSVISGVQSGINIEAAADPANPPPGFVPPGIVPTIAFTAINNRVTATTGPAITASAIFDQTIGFPGRALSRIEAVMSANVAVGGAAAPGILLNTGGDSTLWPGNVPTPAVLRPITVASPNRFVLSNINNNAIVDIQQEVQSVNFAAGTVIPPPPPPPPIPPIP